MQTADILVEAYERIRQLVHIAAEGLGEADLAYRPEPGANSIAWLVWHLTRIQDDHVSEIAGRDQVWVSGVWAAALGMEPDPDRLGQGDGPDDVAAIRPGDASALLGYHAEVMDRTVAYLGTVDDTELSRIIDRSYDPPVSVGVRLVSVLSDNIQHAGQARYLRGIVDRLR
jgi:hypothetical protein